MKKIFGHPVTFLYVAKSNDWMPFNQVNRKAEALKLTPLSNIKASTPFVIRI